MCIGITFGATFRGAIWVAIGGPSLRVFKSSMLFFVRTTCLSGKPAKTLPHKCSRANFTDNLLQHIYIRVMDGTTGGQGSGGSAIPAPPPRENMDYICAGMPSFYL